MKHHHIVYFFLTYFFVLIIHLNLVEELPCCHPHATRCEWQDTIPQCEKRNLEELLWWIDNVIGDDTPWTLTAGTLLGSMRGGGHIKHETDIDIAIDIKDRQRFITQIRNNIQNTHYVLETGGLVDRLFFSNENKIHVDIWTMERQEEKTLEITNVEGKGFVRYAAPNDIIYPIKRQCTYGYNIYPCYNQPEKWVLLRYGDEWKIPKVKYGSNKVFRDGDDIRFPIVDDVKYNIII